MEYYVYLMTNSHKTILYTGVTNNLIRRLYEHKHHLDKAYNNVVLHVVYENDKIVMLDTIKPEEILTEGHQSELVTYKGVMVSKEHSEKDMFKINLLNMIQK